MRPIDADALYETLCHIWDRSDSEEFEQAVFESIANAPTIEVPKWIPCSERLPEREGRYLVTNSAWGSWTVDVCAWIGHWHSDDKPIAWMELPEEWKGEKDETTI